MSQQRKQNLVRELQAIMARGEWYSIITMAVLVLVLATGCAPRTMTTTNCTEQAVLVPGKAPVIQKQCSTITQEVN